MKGFLLLTTCFFICFSAQEKKEDSTKIRKLKAVEFTKKLPTTKEIIFVSKDLDAKNLGQDLPFLLKNQISILSSSDAGNGIGYTSMRIRGISGNAINTMINGVPYNDSESQGTFFVNIFDISSSASQITIQRGVGSSSNGTASFGASINIITKNPENQFYLKTSNSYGSFNTQKYSAEINSGKLLNQTFSFLAKYSKIYSDGYIDRAFSNLNSYHFSALYEKNKTQLKFFTFGGIEKTYQAWNGLTEEKWLENPHQNTAGKYKDLITGEKKFYRNEIDLYHQNHYYFLWNQNFNENWNLETTLHYTKGKGYFENYIQVDENSPYAHHLSEFHLNIHSVTQTDFIRKKWLNNDFYGVVSTLYGKFNSLTFNFGITANRYQGMHFGNVSGVQIQNIINHEFYRNLSHKDELAGYLKTIFKFHEFEFFGDLQLRNIHFKNEILLDDGKDGLGLNKNWNFFNPKIGINYLLYGGKIYTSFAIAHREPNRDALKANHDSKDEKLSDWELGIEKKIGNLSFIINGYLMNYQDELVFSGAISETGNFIRQNVKKSHRLGIEFGTSTKLNDFFKAKGNFTLSQNKISEINSFDENKKLIILKNTPISLSPNILANLSLNFHILDKFSAEITHQYVGKQYLDNTKNEKYTLKPYHTTDFNTKYHLDFQNFNVDLKLSIYNIMNKKYVNNGYVYTPNAYYFPQAGINFMFGMDILIQ